MLLRNQRTNPRRHRNEAIMYRNFDINHTNMAKGLAIFLLLAYHLFENEALVTAMNVNYAPFPLQAFLLITSFGNICVAVFVFLTAFGIASGLLAQGGFSAGKSASGQSSPLSGSVHPAGGISPADACRQAARRFLALALQFAALFLSVNLLWWHRFDYRSLYGPGKQGILFFLTDATGLSAPFDTPTLNETWWYMELAYLLIFLVPLLTWLVQKTGYALLLFTVFAPFAVTFHPDLKRYLFVAVFGVCAAYGKWPHRLLTLKLPRVLQWLIGIPGFVLCILIRQNIVVQEYFIHLTDAPMVLFLVWLAAALLGSIPFAGKLLAFIGKHSMNIYLVHTFFYMTLWREFVYYFKYALITWLLLLTTCLLYSVLLEWLKKITGLNKLLTRIKTISK